MLQHFESWLRPLRSQFVLGGQLIARENELLPGIYHVSHKGQLLAVMDFHEWRIGILRKADPVDCEPAHWDRRPLEAHDIPSHFLRSSLTHLRWIYAQRTERDLFACALPQQAGLFLPCASRAHALDQRAIV